MMNCNDNGMDGIRTTDDTQGKDRRWGTLDSDDKICNCIYLSMQTMI